MEDFRNEESIRSNPGSIPDAGSDDSSIRRKRQSERDERSVGHDVRHEPDYVVLKRGPQDDREYPHDKSIHSGSCR